MFDKIDQKRMKIDEELELTLKKEIVGTIELPPRFGKTRIIINYIDKFHPTGKVLYVTSEKALKDHALPHEFQKWGKRYLVNNVTFSTYVGLSSTKNSVQGEYDVIIFDEVHCITERVINLFLEGKLKAKYAMIGMTGSRIRAKRKLNLLTELGLHNSLVSVDIDEAIEMGILSDYNINVVTCRLDKENNILVSPKGGVQFFTSELKNYTYLTSVIENPWNTPYKKKNTRIQRMHFLKTCKSKEKLASILLGGLKGRTLYFAGSIEQVDRMLPYTYHSQTDKTSYNRFQKGEIRVLGLVNAGGTGHTYRNIKHVIVTQADSDGIGSTTQKIARALLRDKSNKMAEIWILCVRGTVDEEWVSKTLSRFDNSKVTYIDDLETLKKYIEERNESKGSR